jgi:hypothetical protein
MSTCALIRVLKPAFFIGDVGTVKLIIGFGEVDNPFNDTDNAGDKGTNKAG